MSIMPPNPPPANGPNLIKPAGWPTYMVTAALQFTSDSNPPASYPTPDAARLDILNTLNWYEAHAEYAWPDFSTHGHDFSQAMRFRRALVSDVCSALMSAGKVRIADGGGKAKKGVAGGSRRVVERKRKCRRGDESDTEDENRWDRDLEDLLMLAMDELITRAGVDVTRYLRSDKGVGALADVVHEGLLVEVRAGPVAAHEKAVEELQRKRGLRAKAREPSVEL